MLINLGGAAAAALAVLLVVAISNRLKRKALLERLRAGWGQFRDRARDMAAVAGYYRHCTDIDADTALDDRTWDDLHLTDVFSVLDRTETPIGQQLLYARLRSAPHVQRLATFESLVTRMSQDVPARERAQLALVRLSAPAAYNLWRLTQPGLRETAPRHPLFPVAGLIVIGLVVTVPFWQPAIFLLAGVAAGNLIVRATIAERLRAVSEPFRLVNPLLRAAKTLSSLGHGVRPGVVSTLSVDIGRLSWAGRIAGWAGRDPHAPTGAIPALLFDFFNMMLWLDATALLLGARLLAARGPELRRLIAAVGELDVALSVASYRAGTTGWTRPTFQPASALLRGLRHPLLPDAVPNSITLAPPTGVIITGSNMAGKSTFLRTVGVSVVMAQTINTCLAAHYDAPLFVVRSCIGRSDDPASGKSYYLVEVDAVLALVRAARSPRAHLMLFDELFRGTNAVERIAAGEAVLRTLLAPDTNGRPAPHVVMAATHDEELVDLLDRVYAPYHFTDKINEAGVIFDYHLTPGPATTRNAIALLARRGAPSELLAYANARVEVLDQARLTPRPAEPEEALQ